MTANTCLAALARGVGEASSAGDETYLLLTWRRRRGARAGAWQAEQFHSGL